jgi:hypothetical protein
VADCVAGAGVSGLNPTDTLVFTELLNLIGYTGSDAFADGIFTRRTSGANTIVYLDTDGTAGGARSRAFLLVKNAGGQLSSSDFQL